jgi:hypothetical protein
MIVIILLFREIEYENTFIIYINLNNNLFENNKSNRSKSIFHVSVAICYHFPDIMLMSVLCTYLMTLLSLISVSFTNDRLIKEQGLHIPSVPLCHLCSYVGFPS